MPVLVRYCFTLLAALLVCGAASGGSFPGGNGLIAYERQGPTSSVVATFDPAVGTTRELVLGGQPAWSRDGSKLAYVRDEVVYVSNPDGTGAVAVGHGNWPSWSPDGTKLAVGRYDEVALPGSPRVPVQGGAPTRVPTGPWRVYGGSSPSRRSPDAGATSSRRR